MTEQTTLPSLPDGRRFLGRPAKPCRKCGGVAHYVNRLGGISCETCIVPRVGMVILRLTIVGGTWDDADNPFGVPDGSENSGFSKNASRSHSSPSAASNREKCTSGQTDPSNVVRRKDEHLADEEIAWILCEGGVCDQMDAAKHITDVDKYHAAATCRTGETIAEKAGRLHRLRTGQHAHRTFVRSDYGSVPAVLTEELRFVDRSVIDEHGVNRVTHTVYQEGADCLLFVGQKVSPRDPEAAAVEESLKGMKDEAKTKAVIRLDGMLRIVDSKKVKAL